MKYLSGSGLGYFWKKIEAQLNVVYKKNETYSKIEVDNKFADINNKKIIVITSDLDLRYTGQSGIESGGRILMLDGTVANWNEYEIVSAYAESIDDIHSAKAVIANVKIKQHSTQEWLLKADYIAFNMTDHSKTKFKVVLMHRDFIKQTTI